MQHEPDGPPADGVVRFDLVADRDAPAHARSFVRSQAEALLGCSDQDLVLLTSEIVTNVVSHTATETLHLELCVSDEVLRVEVWDEDEAMPSLTPKDPETPGGFGMQMVDQLALRWGVTPCEAGGKRVWFECPHPVA